MTPNQIITRDVIEQLITAGEALRHYSDCDSKAAVEAEEHWFIAKGEAEELLSKIKGESVTSPCEGGAKYGTGGERAFS